MGYALSYRTLSEGVHETRATRRFHMFRQSLRARRLNLRPPDEARLLNTETRNSLIKLGIPK